MTPAQREQFRASINRQMDEHIRHYGWGVMGIVDDGSSITHVYTVGLVLSQGFDLVSTAAVDIKTLQPLINELATRIQGGHPWKDGYRSAIMAVTVDGVEHPLRMGVRLVSHAAIEASDTPFAFTRADTFPVYQLILADKHNILPTEDGYDVNFEQTLWPAVQ